MPHFAYAPNGVVQRVERVQSDSIHDEFGDESEAAGQAYLAALYPGSDPADFILTHYPVGQSDPYPRGKYAGPGDLWDGTSFITPEPPPLP